MAHAREALWNSGHDEAVEVNQRALIDKVLARYSAEFTVFRELLQNSDDAGATAVEIHFETKAHLDCKNGKYTDHYRPADESPGSESLPNLKTTPVHQWIFKNNGVIFRDEDWNRLKKIAEGNPDEEKIGAFGVGFYSLFSVTEEPFVTSGGQWMGFYWKDGKDQLFARRGTLSAENSDLWTTFEMSLREPAPIPPPFDFTRFLASSITFMAHLMDVSVYLDDKCLSRLTKDRGVSEPTNIPKGLKNSSPLGTMHVMGIQKTLRVSSVHQGRNHAVRLRRWLRETSPNNQVVALKSTGGGFFSSIFSSLTGASTPLRSSTPLPSPSPTPQIDLTAINECSVVLTIFAAEIGVKLDRKMNEELYRSTKKNPPAKMRFELIYTGKDEYDASKKEDEKQPKATGSVFQGLRADLDGAGAAKVFIGHSTRQATGLGGHMSGRFIPTVERESIDLVDRNVAVWNKELLYVGGFLSRAAYELEMENIRKLWDAAVESMTTTGRKLNAQPDKELQAWLRGRCLHALKFFTFHPSTPSPLVSSSLEEAFFSCIVTHPFAMLSSPRSLLMVSTAGVHNASDIRYPDPAFSGFLKELPVVPEDILTGAKSMIESLRIRGMLKDITFLDVLQELRSRPLSEPEMAACFKWWIDICDQGDVANLNRIRPELLNAAVLTMGEMGSPEEKIVPMSSIQSFLNTRSMGYIPVDGPLPPHLLPVSLSKQFDPHALSSAFSWRELSVLEWLKYIVQLPSPHPIEHDVNRSASWAERVLQVLARAWPSLSKTNQDEVVALLESQTCIPTSSGLKTPQQAYFQSAHVFHDLPVVTMPSGTVVKGPLERLLQAVGVRKHVDLQIVFNRMIKTGDWTIAELIKYLVAVQTTLTPVEFNRLQMTSAFPKEQSAGSEAPEKQTVLRYKASELYEPLDVFRELHLPVIDWGIHPKWRGNSEEAKFLFKLGLMRFPPLPVVINLASSQDVAVRAAALKYFLDNFAIYYADFDPSTFADLAFIPALKDGTHCLAKPSDVFSSPCWATLGFMVADPSLKSDSLEKLKISEHPPTSQLVSLLKTSPPQSHDTARKWFEILAVRITAFSQSELKTLAQLPFVPVKNDANTSIHLLPPNQCYFSGDSSAQFHSKLFVFVDFGTQANAFLSACDTRHEPSVEEITRILLSNPRQFYQLAEGRDNYLTELRNIAVNRRLISSGTLSRLKRAPVLLGTRRVKKSKGQDTQADLDEDDWEMEYDLLTTDKVVIADETNAYQLFGSEVFTAPQEDLLEGFYTELGCKRLSSLIREEYRTSSEIKGSRKAVEVRSLILERLPLFLHEHTHTRIRVPYTWLNNDRNFTVKTFGKLTVLKTLNFAEKRSLRSQDASAVAKRDGRGPIELWLAGHDQVDMYELLFDSPKVNDALLFMTILSTDLRALRRRGYNVDRILRQQKAEREAAEEAAREKAKSTALISHHDSDSKDTLVPVGLKPTSAFIPAANQLDSLPAGHSESSDAVTKQASRPVSAIRQSLEGWRRKFTNETIRQPRETSPPGPETRIPGTLPEISLTPNAQALSHENRPSSPDAQGPSPDPRSRALPQTPQPFVTPRSKIASNIDLAIKACREEKGQLLRNREHMEVVKESLNEGYCDISGQPTDMTLVGKMGDIKIFVTKDVPDPQSIITTKGDVLARFIYTIGPLAQLYALPPTSVHIFYDCAGGLIAFNRNASLFLNVRYFEEWHDSAVRNGDSREAYTSWFFTLAHEIAHNLVQPHNSEHEFWFSSICEVHLPAFAKLLSP
ncbi:hypothetical protein A0H81_13686 [Grifola frondosa]|uniref:Sacsin/Nov domain-containing protein n=1 Tax=Grifola frondosa TaxID=5627 RepID=A0A1C7LUJ4_GRIFR|nr:hypothetical protein A0H81_13686 [Grifola frondosa]